MSAEPHAHGAPFGPGSVSLSLYPHASPPGEQMETLLRQGELATRSGFDGVTVAEHHGGFPGYLPNPLQITGWLLDRMERGWSAPLPLLLPLRSPGLVAEEVAWLAARHPGRVGLGVAPGYVEDDFTAAGVPFAGRLRRHWDAVGPLLASLSGKSEGPLASDAAVAALGGRPVPLVSTAKGPKSVAHAAASGVGIFPTGFVDDVHQEIFGRYRAQGGVGPAVIMRWAWLGDAADHIEPYASQTNVKADRSWAPTQLVPRLVETTPEALARRLFETFEGSTATSLSLRFHSPSISPAAIEEQITRVGTEVLPLVRELLAARAV